MAREKVTITLDRSKADRARSMAGAASTSAVIDLALDRFIRTERLRRDIAAYAASPPAPEILDIAVSGPAADLADDTDWASLYADLLE